MNLRVITTGGTIDKIYFDAKSEYQVGEPQIGPHPPGLAGIHPEMDVALVGPDPDPRLPSPAPRPALHLRR